MSNRQSQPFIVYSELLARILKDEPLIMLDVGSRGGIEPSWRTIPSPTARVFAFEADKSYRPLSQDSQFAKIEHLPYALWSNNSKSQLYQAKNQYTSSIGQPDQDILAKYETRAFRPRLTHKIIPINTRTLDSIIEERKISPDFIKIDVQGAEYEVIAGGRQSFADSLVGALVETWTLPIHKNQHLAHEVLSQLYGNNFTLFNINQAAAWHRRHTRNIGLTSHKQIIGLNMLVFKDPTMTGIKLSRLKQIKLSALAELYGHVDFAYDILQQLPSQDQQSRQLRRMIVSNNQLRKNNRRFLYRFLHKGRLVEPYAKLAN